MGTHMGTQQQIKSAYKQHSTLSNYQFISVKNNGEPQTHGIVSSQLPLDLVEATPSLGFLSVGSPPVKQ